MLYERINQRVDAMMTQGILAEAEIAMALPADSTARKAIGYKDLFGYLTGDESLEQATEPWKQASRRYANRQITQNDAYGGRGVGPHNLPHFPKTSENSSKTTARDKALLFRRRLQEAIPYTV